MILVLCFGPKACSQGIAWANMLLSYVPEAGLIEGFSQTFSDQRPCALCKSIEKSDSEKDSAYESKRQEHFTKPKHLRDQHIDQSTSPCVQAQFLTLLPQCFLNIE